MGVERGAVLRHRLAEQRRALHFADHVQIVIAGRAIGAEADIHAGPVQRRRRAKPAGQFQVGLRAMRHTHAEPGQFLDLSRLKLRHMHGQQARA